MYPLIHLPSILSLSTYSSFLLTICPSIGNFPSHLFILHPFFHPSITQSEKSETVLVQSRLALCNPKDYSPLGLSIHKFSRQEYWGS